MDLKVLWTNTASQQLEDVFDYYKVTANLTIARKIVKAIVKKSASLSKQQKKSQREPPLAGKKKEYRYLVEGNYKIVYWVDELTVHIATVFDTR